MQTYKKPKVLLLGTGGTIAGIAPDLDKTHQYVAGVVDIATVLGKMNGADSDSMGITERLVISTRQLFNIDSKDIHFGHWRELAFVCESALADPSIDAVLITHGTDTVEETAYFLSRVMNAKKPVVLTCAMRPFNAPDADGSENLLHSLLALENAMMQNLQGVVLVAAAKIWSARDVEKMYPRKIDAFFSREPQTDFVWINPPVRIKPEHLPEADAWPWVEIVSACAGANNRAVDALVQAGVKGLVVSATGNGTLHSELEACLIEAQEKGVCIWRTSRCVLGLLEPAPLARFPALDLSPIKARIEMVLYLISEDLK